MPRKKTEVTHGTIYCLTNKVNNKKYIGFTTQLKDRLICHKAASKHHNTHIARAVRKYGWENFEVEVLCVNKDHKFTLEVMEPYYIKIYDSIKSGYNMSSGGDKSALGITFKKTPEAIEKSRRAALGRKMSDSAREAISKDWLITTPEGATLQIKNLYRFCRENKLSPVSMSKIAKGKLKSTTHKGYSCKYG